MQTRRPERVLSRLLNLVVAMLCQRRPLCTLPGKPSLPHSALRHLLSRARGATSAHTPLFRSPAHPQPLVLTQGA